MQRTSALKLAVVDGDRAAPDFGDFAQQYGRIGDRLAVDGFSSTRSRNRFN